MRLISIFVILFSLLSSITSLFSRRIIYFQEVQQRFGNDNKLIRLAQPPILYDSIIYESSLDLLFVLTKKSIMKFSGSNFKLLETRSMFSPSSTDQCLKFKYLPRYVCHSMGYWASSTSRMIVKSSASQMANKKLFICYNNGTAIFLNMKNLQTKIDPVSRCFPDSILNIASQDNGMYGIVLNSAPIFIRYHPKYPTDLIQKPSKNLLTLSDSNWLQQDDYIETIKIFESDSHVYLIFREVAEEVKMYCNKKVVRSRVGRVDKTDEGGTKYQLKENWVTFVKATITCPLVSYQDKSVTHLNFVEDAYYDVSQKMIYATFSDSEIGPHKTAVCSYTLVSIDGVLDGTFYNKNKPAQPVSTGETDCKHNRFDCKISKARRYQLKFNKISTKYNLIQTPQEIWTKIVTMTQERSSNQYTIVFVATNQFQLHKFYKKSTETKLCYSETIKLSNHYNSSSTMDKIVDFKIINSRNSIEPFLVVSTTKAIFKVSIENCQLYSTKESCVDILCFWSSIHNKCSTIYTIPVYELRSLAEMPKCAETDTKSPVSASATKTEWNMWESCGSIDNRCMCRQRKCKPGMCVNNRFGNTNVEFQVFNCTKLHEWSSWSMWSACSATCGIGVMSRKRWCYPKSGLCKGRNIEKKVCKAKVACKDAENQKPGPWTECSKLCGSGGFSYRRKCQDNSMDQCNFLEWKECSGTKCGRTEKLSPSILLKTQNGVSSYFTALCSTKEPNDNSISVAVDSQIENYSGVETKVSSCWSEWSNCSNCNPDRSLGENPSNSRHRNRSCLLSGIQGAHYLCYGTYKESDDCGELCGYKIKTGSFRMGLNFEFELVYILIVGVASFTISLIVTLVVFYCIVKKKRLVSNTTSRMSNNMDSDKPSVMNSYMQPHIPTLPRNLKQPSPIQMTPPRTYYSHSPSNSPTVEAATGFFADQNMSTIQRMHVFQQQRSTPPQPQVVLNPYQFNEYDNNRPPYIKTKQDINNHSNINPEMEIQ